MRIGLLNTVNAAGGNENLYNDTAAKHYVVCKDKAANPLVDVLPPIRYGEKYDVITEYAQAEVRQISVVGADLETVVASRRYAIGLHVPNQTYESGYSISPVWYAYLAPTTLTGSGTTDRYNMYYDLVGKINGNAFNNVEAKLIQVVPFKTGNVAPAIGATVTQAVSGYTGVVAGYRTTSGAWAGTAAGFLYLYDTTGTMNAVNNYSWAGGTAVNDGVGLPGQAMAIIDDAGYYPAPPNPRKGATQIVVPKFDQWGNPEWEDAVSEIYTVSGTGWTGVMGRLAVYSKGIGSVMATYNPTFRYDGRDVNTGDAENYYIGLTGLAPIAGDVVDPTKNYTRFTIVKRVNAYADSVSDLSNTNEVVFQLYADESGGTGGGTPIANLKTLLEAMV